MLLETEARSCGVLQTRHKRNATFPGGKSITMIHQPPRIVAATEKAHMSTRPRFNSCHTDPGCRVSASSETLATPLNTDVFTPQPTLLTPGTSRFFYLPTDRRPPPRTMRFGTKTKYISTPPCVRHKQEISKPLVA